jgi:SAM-dependent methyltransferase
LSARHFEKPFMELTMRRLSDQSYWEKTNGYRSSVKTNSLSAFFKRAIGARRRQLFCSYKDYLLWEVVFPHLLPSAPGLRALEIGSAPGRFLVELHSRFKYDPYGVEYTESGVLSNRHIFETHGLDPQHIVHADFFSDDFQKRYRGFFDIVISRGFIEHFDDPKNVVKQHVALLKRGGYLIVSIPNKRGMNRVLASLFNKQSLSIHNLGIMHLPVFRELFDDSLLRVVFCRYIGVFSFNQFDVPPASRLRFLLSVCRLTQRGLNMLFRLLFPRQGPESGWFSPYLLYIGTATQ